MIFFACWLPPTHRKEKRLWSWKDWWRHGHEELNSSNLPIHSCFSFTGKHTYVHRPCIMPHWSVNRGLAPSAQCMHVYVCVPAWSFVLACMHVFLRRPWCQDLMSLIIESTIAAVNGRCWSGLACHAMLRRDVHAAGSTLISFVREYLSLLGFDWYSLRFFLLCV